MILVFFSNILSSRFWVANLVNFYNFARLKLNLKTKSMSIVIRKVECKSDLLTFVTYANNLYKGHPFYVPALVPDELPVFDPKTNAAYEFCECGCYLAYKDGKVAGRVAAIINHKANSTWNKKEVRFGWIDFIDDPEVSEALVHTVMDFGRQRGMTEIAGPLGFTDFDPEGMLVEGFDRMGTLVGIYNHPYYKIVMDGLLEKIPAEAPSAIKYVLEYEKNRKKTSENEMIKELGISRYKWNSIMKSGYAHDIEIPLNISNQYGYDMEFLINNKITANKFFDTLFAIQSPEKQKDIMQVFELVVTNQEKEYNIEMQNNKLPL